MSRVGDMRLPQLPNVSYLVSWQGGRREEAPASCVLRSDVRVVCNQAQGLAANRNAALSAASGDILLIADDDLQYSAEGLLGIIDVFERHPEIQLAAFRYSGPDNKRYPEEETRLRAGLPHFHVTAFEMAVRREARKWRFDERFGLGAPYFGAGEDSVFLLQALREGVEARFFPLTVCHHPGLTTGYRSEMTPAALRASGAFIVMEQGRWRALTRIPLKAWRLWRGRRTPFLIGLRYLSEGAIAIQRRK